MKKAVYGFAAVALIVVVAFLASRGKLAPGLSRLNSTNFQPASSSAPTASEGNLTLTITSPQDKEVVTSPILVVKGKTAPSAEVFVNDQQAVADSNGDFSLTLTLDEGENTLDISANDTAGNYVERELTVTLQPQE